MAEINIDIAKESSVQNAITAINSVSSGVADKATLDSIVSKIGESDSTSDTDVMGKLNNPKPSLKFSFNHTCITNDHAFTTVYRKPYVVGKISSLFNTGTSTEIQSGIWVKKDNYLYYVSLNAIYVIDIETRTFIEKITVNFPQPPHSAAELNGIIYIISGTNTGYSNLIYIYNIATKTLTTKATSPSVTLGNSYATIENVNGVLYIAAGTKIYTCSPSIVLTEVASFEKAQSMSISFAVGNKIYYFFGNVNSVAPYIYVFNVDTKIVEGLDIKTSYIRPASSPYYDSSDNCVYYYGGNLRCFDIDNKSTTLTTTNISDTPFGAVSDGYIVSKTNGVVSLIGRIGTYFVSYDFIPNLAKTTYVYPISLKSGSIVNTHMCSVVDSLGNDVVGGEILEDGIYYIFGNLVLNFSIY